MIFFILLFPFVAEAKYDVTPRCFRELETKFFNQSIVSTALSLYSVPQGSWGSINRELQQMSANNHQRVWNAASRLPKNPLDNVYVPDLAAPVLREVLFSEFQQACQNNFVTSDDNIRAMFEYIEQQQAAKIRACFGRDTFIPQKKEKKK